MNYIKYNRLDSTFKSKQVEITHRKESHRTYSRQSIELIVLRHKLIMERDKTLWAEIDGILQELEKILGHPIDM